MNLKELSKQYYKQALEEGKITLESGVEIALNATQILQVAKLVLNEEINLDAEEVTAVQSSMPTELLPKLEYDTLNYPEQLNLGLVYKQLGGV